MGYSPRGCQELDTLSDCHMLCPSLHDGWVPAAGPAQWAGARRVGGEL